MTWAGQKEGLRAPLSASAVVLLVICYEIASAQTIDRSDLELCVGLDTPELKLVCFEAIIAASRAQEDSGKQPSASSHQEIEDSIEAPAQPVTDPAVSGKQVASDPEPAPPESDRSLSDEAVQQSDAPRKDDVIVATVTEVRRAANKKLYFTLDNGQVWRQMENGYIQYPREGDFEIEISRGIMGDYRLRVGGEGRMTRIVRAQ